MDAQGEQGAPVGEAPKEPGADAPGDVAYAWAPTPAPPRRRRLGRWLGTPAAVVLVGVIAASLILIAPGTAVAGVAVGGMTPGAAAAAIQAHLDRTSIRLTGVGIDATLTGADLGARVDAQALAHSAFQQHPMWNLAAWFAGRLQAPVALDEARATAALRRAAPALYQDPTDAGVRFDAGSGMYVASPAAQGTKIDLGTVTAALEDAFAGGTPVAVHAVKVPASPAVSSATADSTAASLNTLLDTIGFYVGDERAVPVDRKVAASWLTVTPAGGTLAVTADTAAIQRVVDTLAAKVDRKPRTGVVVTDTAGKTLGTAVEPLDGRSLGDTSGAAAAFAAQLATGDGKHQVPVTLHKATTTTVSRSAVVDLSDQRAYFYQDGKLWRSYLVSTGAVGHATPTGYFRVFAKVPMQDMGCFPGAEYCTRNVPWVTYFAPDVGFHGTYWHRNFGHVMSHGCVNMPIDVAKYIYDWAPYGMEVTVRR
jgi:lipoprotein-anchoring transpeptidase ErfK/SrfK